MYNNDFASEDDMIEISPDEYEQEQEPRAGPSRPRASIANEIPFLLADREAQRQRIRAKIVDINTEVEELDERIVIAERHKALCLETRTKLQKELEKLSGLNAMVNNTKSKGKGKAQGLIDYTAPGFEWTNGLKAKMEKIFGINEFRLCQEGVCNANMDGRDIVCVMPTGGGKSLTYQLPALLTPGCTLVISPLISLITDQILHLREAGIEAVMLTAGTSKEETDRIRNRLDALAKRQGTGQTSDDIKLCYVTPEKIAKSKVFRSWLERLARANQLARIVIDEAHCVSQLGHDFRPDYRGLSVLRQLYPGVPIMALSATCPPKVLNDLISILRLKPKTEGNAATTEGTVYFSSPLYRKNLHYNVVPKPSSSKAHLQAMTEYILEHHKQDTGIIYCATVKDTTVVAEAVRTLSKGVIKTGVYHAKVADREKETLHKNWRKGDIKVVCATIAFGMGIDKGDVRFVLHHSLSKSIDGFYQESGRAGRDGKDADCVLYYRPQDYVRMSGMLYSEKDGTTQLQNMVKFAQNMRECRKIQFAKYFSATSEQSLSSWSTEDVDALAPCNHCDNCTRSSTSFTHRFVTHEAWKLLQIVALVDRQKSKLTQRMLGELARGSGGGSLSAIKSRKGRAPPKEKLDIDLDAICGGKIDMSTDEIETLIVELSVTGYLDDLFVQTAYATNVYLKAGYEAPRLLSISRDRIASASSPQIECSFRTKTRATKTTNAKAGSRKDASSGQKRKRNQISVSEDSASEVEFEDDDDDVNMFADIPEESIPLVDDSDDDQWQTTIRHVPKKLKTVEPARQWPPTRSRSKVKIPVPTGEVYELSSD